MAWENMRWRLWYGVLTYQHPTKLEIWKKKDGQGLAIREAKNVHHSASTPVEPTGKKTKEKAKVHLVEEFFHRDGEKRV